MTGRGLARFCVGVLVLMGAAWSTLTGMDSLPDWDLQRQGAFVSAVAADRCGTMWAGTAEHGLWHGAAGDPQWTQVTQRQGLAADDVTALAADREGRIWVGHAFAGLSVGNGAAWQTYGPLDCPVGDHVTCIGICEKDGRMWIGSNTGVSSWRREEGWDHLDLPVVDEPTCLAIDPQGTVLVGTGCHGAFALRGNARRPTWTPLAIPASRNGDGLSDQINVIAVTQGKVWVGSGAGLAVSEDQGNSWQNLRGPARDGSSEAKPDPVMALCPLPGDTMIVGFRHHGLASVDGRLRGFRVLASDPAAPSRDWVSSVLSPNPGEVVVGWWGGGLSHINEPANHPVPRAAPVVPGSEPPFPQRMPAPTAADLGAILVRLKRDQVRDLPANSGYLLANDYTTRGDWVGRYGRQGAILCAASAPLDHELMLSNELFGIECQLGVHAAEDDGLRHWIHWLQSTDPNVLWDPFIGARRQAEWDDHGEAYALSSPGPDLVVTVSIAAPGTFRLSSYFFNKDGLGGSNRFRDFVVDLKRAPPDRSDPDKIPTLARTRIHQFDQGVYARFKVAGPGRYLLHVKRNSSFNTIVSGIFIDRILGPDTEDGLTLPMLGGFTYGRPLAQFTPAEVSGDEALARAAELWSWLDAHRQGQIDHEQDLRLAAYRCALASLHDDSHPALRSWRWSLPLWTAPDRTEFLVVMRAAFARQSAQASSNSHTTHPSPPSTR